MERSANNGRGSAAGQSESERGTSFFIIEAYKRKNPILQDEL
jgi:hypothetical protein